MLPEDLVIFDWVRANLRGRHWKSIKLLEWIYCNAICNECKQVALLISCNIANNSFRNSNIVLNLLSSMNKFLNIQGAPSGHTKCPRRTSKEVTNEGSTTRILLYFHWHLWEHWQYLKREDCHYGNPWRTWINIKWSEVFLDTTDVWIRCGIL